VAKPEQESSIVTAMRQLERVTPPEDISMLWARAIQYRFTLSYNNAFEID